MIAFLEQKGKRKSMHKTLLIVCSIMLLATNIPAAAWQQQTLVEPHVERPSDVIWKGKRLGGYNAYNGIKAAAEQGNPYGSAIWDMRECLRVGAFTNAQAFFREAVTLDRERAPYDEWGDALAARGDLRGAIEAYRQTVYHPNPTVTKAGEPAPPPRDWIDSNGRSVRQMVEQNGGKGWVAKRSASPDLLMRYVLLLLRAGEVGEAAQAYEWGYEATSHFRPRFEGLERLFDLKPTKQVVNKNLLAAAAHTIIGLTEPEPRTFEEWAWPPDVSIREYRKALALKPDLDVVFIYLSRKFQDKEFVHPRYPELVKEAWQLAETSKNEAVRKKARELLGK